MKKAQRRASMSMSRVSNHIIFVIVLVLVAIILHDSTLISARPRTRKRHRTLSEEISKKSSPLQHFSSFFNAKEGDVLTLQPADVHTDHISSPDISKEDVLRLVSSEGLVTLSTSSYYTQWRGGGPRDLRLFSRVGIGFHLEIEKNGKIVGRHFPSKYSLLQIFSVDRGIVGIKGKESGRYLCMNKRGRISGKKRFGPECQFEENVEANNFNTYASTSTNRRNRTFYLSFTKRGIPKKGKKIPKTAMHKTAHWLPIMLNV